MNKKVAAKWQARNKKKEESNDNDTSINFSFKTHQISESQAQIIIPQAYPEFNKNNSIFVIEIGKQKVLAQLPRLKTNTAFRRQSEEKNQISVLKTLMDLERIQCGPTGTLKGHIKSLTSSKIDEYNLEFVEFIVKETYFSRRDQYKVIKALKQSVTHVFLKKTLYFDEISLEVVAMMKSNTTIVKSGIIDKNTRMIFRTTCSKMTIGIQISTDTFELNEKKELYLEKMIQFLEVYIHRVNFFNVTHRLTFLLYGKCFYPQFKTLADAYDRLHKQITSSGENQKFQRNFAVALQKDSRGRVYQDVYRRFIWPSDDVTTFRQFIWERINEFLFTINWCIDQKSQKIAHFLKSSLSRKMRNEDKQYAQQVDSEAPHRMKIRPFVHKLKCQLAPSRDTNLFEAISLISEQYRHHYQFRTLTETGNTIIMLSAGPSEYEVDLTSYKMTKSYVYLTNVNCSLINFGNKTETAVRANLVELNQNPIFENDEARKLDNLSLHCIQKQIYMSPTKQDLMIRDDFCNKSVIYPKQMKLANKERSKYLNKIHKCDKDIHYELFEEKIKTIKEIKQKIVSFINVYTFDDRFLHTHKILYEKLVIPQSHLPTVDGNKIWKNQFDIFADNLDKILVSKNEWGLEFNDNQINKKLHCYRQFKGDKKEKTIYGDKMAKNIFKLSNYVEPNNQNENKFQTTSITEGTKPYEGRNRMKRRTSETFMSDIIGDSGASAQANSFGGNNNKKVNIFEKTYTSTTHEYVAGQKEQSKTKKNSSHNKERLRNQYPQSNIHYIMASYNELTLKKLKAFIRKQFIQEFKDQQESIVFLFETQKMWKNLTFPLLTPIYTKYKEMFKEIKEFIGSAVTNDTNNKYVSVLQDEMCKLLMKNFQIQESHINYNMSHMVTKLSKGQVCCKLTMYGTNLTRYYLVDMDKQRKIVPNLLYRYLSYEDKDCRFCSKYIYFKDKNYFPEGKKIQLETKIVKIALCSEEAVSQQIMIADSSNNKKDHFLQFFKAFSQKYKQFSMELKHIEPRTKPKKKKFVINFSKNEKRVLYNHEEIQIDIDIEYNHFTMFQILISWQLCSSVIIKQFVDNIMTMGRRNKLSPALLSSGNIFNTVWSITTIGEIVLNHHIGLELLEAWVGRSGEQMWDSENYYFHISGISFIKFVKEKSLVLWRDNNHEKRSRDIRNEDSSQQYIKFFSKAACFEFVGEIIENACRGSKIDS